MIPEPQWTPVGREDEFVSGKGKQVTIGIRQIGVFLSEGKWYALKNKCPHAGVGLHAGIVKGCTVACPAHGWIFDLNTGEVQHGIPGRKAVAYPVRITQGVVEVGL